MRRPAPFFCAYLLVICTLYGMANRRGWSLLPGMLARPGSGLFSPHGTFHK